MNAYTRQDLSVMQAWPLARKIQVTQTRIMEWYYHYGGNVAVSFSGGKDSTVLLDMARRAFPEIRAVFVDTGLEYPEMAAPGARLPESEREVRLPHRLQGGGAAHLLRPQGQRLGLSASGRIEQGRHPFQIQ